MARPDAVVSEGLGSLLSGPGVQGPIRADRSVDTEAVTLDAASEVEETPKTPTADGLGGILAGLRPEDLGGDEGVALVALRGGSDHSGLAVVPQDGAGVSE